MHGYTMNVNILVKERTCCAWSVPYKTATVLKGQDLGGGQGGHVFLKSLNCLLMSLQPAN